MPYETTWLLQGRIIRTDFFGEMTEETVQEATCLLVELLDEGNGPLVHVITDTSRIGHFPIKVGLASRASAEGMHHPKLGWMVFITDNRMIKYLASVVTGIAHVRFRAFGTLEEGLAFLNHVDSTLPPLLAHQHDDD